MIRRQYIKSCAYVICRSKKLYKVPNKKQLYCKGRNNRFHPVDVRELYDFKYAVNKWSLQSYAEVNALKAGITRYCKKIMPKDHHRID